jgi:hypothetical protein
MHTPWSNPIVEAKGLEPSNLLTASQALYQLSYAPEGGSNVISRSLTSWPLRHRVEFRRAD